MGEVLLKLFSFLLIIFMGHFLRRLGVFQEGDYKVFLKAILNLTIPCAIITSFYGFVLDPALLCVILLSLGLDLTYIGIGFLLTRNSDAKSRSFVMINLPCFNIGCFGLPFAQAFLGAEGVVVACLFDMGNSMICTGGSYALASLAAPGEGRPRITLKETLQRLFGTVPFVVYIVMVVLTLFHIAVPAPLVTLIEPVARANTFVSMLMIGLMLDFHFDPRLLRSGRMVLLARLVLAPLTALGIFWLFPVSLTVRRILVLLVLTPLSALSPVFTARAGGSVELAAAINSLSMVVSIPVLVIMLFCFGIS